jgi:hypothetical protein
LVLSAALCVASARAELLLTPTVLEVEKEGGKSRHFAFSDGAQTVTYQPPRGWDYSGSATQLTLRPPNKTQAQATISRVPLLQPGTFDEESLKKLVSEAIALVPPGSEGISVLSQEKNLLKIQSKETFLITLSYTFYGQKFGRSILLLNRGNEQIRLQLTCRDTDFKDLHRAFLASQGTWQNL